MLDAPEADKAADEGKALVGAGALELRPPPAKTAPAQPPAQVGCPSCMCPAGGLPFLQVPRRWAALLASAPQVGCPSCKCPAGAHSLCTMGSACGRSKRPADASPKCSDAVQLNSVVFAYAPAGGHFLCTMGSACRRSKRPADASPKCSDAVQFNSVVFTYAPAGGQYLCTMGSACRRSKRPADVSAKCSDDVQSNSVVFVYVPAGVPPA